MEEQEEDLAEEERRMEKEEELKERRQESEVGPLAGVALDGDAEESQEAARSQRPGSFGGDLPHPGGYPRGPQPLTSLGVQDNQTDA